MLDPTQDRLHAHDAGYCPGCYAEWEELLRDKRSAADLHLPWCPGCQKAHEGDLCSFASLREYFAAHIPAPEPCAVCGGLHDGPRCPVAADKPKSLAKLAKHIGGLLLGRKDGRP